MKFMYLIVYFVRGEKKIWRSVFESQATAQQYAIVNKLDSWHLVQLEVYPD